MLQIEQKQTQEITEHGVGLHLIVDKVEPDTNLFQNEENLTTVGNLFSSGDVIHNEILKIIEDIDASTTTYDRDVIASIFDRIVKLDQQSYADIMAMIRAVLVGLNDKAYTLFANSIKHISNNENNTPDAASEESDTAKEQVEETEEATSEE